MKKNAARTPFIDSRHGFSLFILFLICASAFYSRESPESTLFVHRYFFDHWLLSYDHGFIRRGLLGSVLNSLGGLQHNLIFVNLLAFSAAAAVIGSLLRPLTRLFPPGNGASLLFISAVIFSPLISIFFECMGDPLQLSLLLTFFSVHLMEKRPWPVFYKAMLFAAAGVISVLIHEAALFIAGPFIFFILWSSPKEMAARGKAAVAKWASLVLYAVILGAAVLGIRSHDKMTVQKKDKLVQQMYSHNDVIQLLYATGADNPHPVILRPVDEEIKKYNRFSDKVKREPLAVVILRVLAIPLFLCSMFYLMCAYQKSAWYAGLWRDFLYCFLSSLILSLPLYFVAHDWGRFSMYTLAASLYLSCRRRIPATGSVPSSGPIAGQHETLWSAGAAAFSSTAFRKLFCLAMLVFITFPVPTNYTVDGLGGQFFLWVGLPVYFIFRLFDPGGE